jgi:enediyne biosynthesis protein E4
MALDIVMTGMGLGVGDINSDGMLDFVMPEWNGIHMRESNELGFYVETAYSRGVYNDNGIDQKVGWGAEMADFDNDADLDIHIAFGNLDTTIYDAPDQQPNAHFIQAEGTLGSFTDEAADNGLADVGHGRGFVVMDINRDGWQDIIMRDLGGPSVLYRSRCGLASWTTIRLHQQGMNRFAVGARVRLWSGGNRQLRVVTAGGTGHASGGPPEVHFGLADSETIDRVEVLWPDGSVSNLWDLPARRTLDLTRND